MKTRVGHNELHLIPLERLLADCKPTIDMYGALNVDIRKLIETYVYEWGQYIDRIGYYSHFDDRELSPEIVIETVVTCFMNDAYLPPFYIHVGKRTDNELYGVIAGIGKLVFNEMLTNPPLLTSGHIGAIEGWCGDNLIVRMIKL